MKKILPSLFLLAAWAFCAPEPALSGPSTRVIRLDFEKDGGPYTLTPPGVLQGNSLGGSRGLVAVCPEGGGEWNEVLHTTVGAIPPESILHLTFQADFKTEAPKARGYLLVRSLANAKDQLIWIDLTNTKAKAFDLFLVTKKTEDYRIIVGVHKQGTLRLDDLVLEITPASVITPTRLATGERRFESPGGTSYWLDSVKGDDARDGKSAAKAWKSLERVNATTFGPGDRLLLSRGGVWQGILAPGGSGIAGKPITVAATGAGARPIILAREQDQAAFHLSNQSFWEVSDLELVNKGKMSEILGSLRYGVLILARDAGTLRHIVLSNLYVHDVNASVIKNSGRAGWGIMVKANGKDTLWDGVRITHCLLERCDRNGIQVANGSYADRATFTPNRGVVISHNTLRDIGGDGIVPIGCKGTLVEYNTVSDCHKRAGKYPGEYSAGLWPWSCDDTLFQFNEAYATHFTTDGQGFDCDYNCSNTVFQYNYSHDNEGGFMLICCNGEPAGYNQGNIGSIVRYNISQNDGERIFAVGGPSVGTRVYNNTIYMNNPKLKYAVQFSSWGGFAKDTAFYNNIFYDTVGAVFQPGEATGTVFSGNLYFGKSMNLPQDGQKSTFDPQFVDGGKGATGLGTLGGYRLRKGSPALGAGVPISNHGGRDFFGNPVGAGKPSIGACEKAAP